MNTLPVVDKYVARLLMVSFFLPMQWQVWTVMATCGYFVIRTAADKTYPPGRNYLWAFLLGSGYFLYVFAIPFTPAAYKNVVEKICEYRAAFLVMPFVFAFVSQQYKKIIINERMIFVYACVIYTAITNIAFIDHYFLNPVKAPPGWHLSHTDYRIFFETFIGIHPTYTGMYLCFSICILLLSPRAEKNAVRILNILVLYLLIVFTLALMAKAPLLALVIILAHYGYRERKQLFRYKWLFAGMDSV
jgi:hypothetical protein